MALTKDELAYVRSEIGDATPPTDGDLNKLHDRLGTPMAVATEVLRKRLANLVAEGPASFSADDYSQNTSANIAALQRQLDRLEGVGGAAPVGPRRPLTIGRIERSYDR